MNEVIEIKKSINEISTDTKILINYLEKEFVKEGRDFIPYSELSAAINRDVQQGARHLMDTAKKRVQAEHNLLLRPVFGEGIKKTTDLSGACDHTIKCIGRKARRTVKEVSNATIGKELCNDELIHVNSRLSHLGAIMVFTKPKAVKRIESEVRKRGTSQIPTADTLKLFEK